MPDELDELFDAPLPEFTRVRNELAKRLRKEGREEQAAEVAGLRKPPVPVWVVNQLSRRHRRDVDLLLDAGHRLREAQGEDEPENVRAGFARARDAEREATQKLLRKAEQLLREEHGSASPATLERVAETLRSAAVTEEGRELLARGRLTEELTATGFDVAATLVSPSKEKPPRRPAPKRDLAAEREARERRREAQKQVRAAERRVAAARKELEAAERELADVQGEAEALG